MNRASIPLTLSSFASLPRTRVLRGVATALCCALMSACAVGPDYQRPAVDVGEDYKQRRGQSVGEIGAAVATAASTEGWTPAQPQDQIDRGQWWRLYRDSTLDELMAKLNAANQTIAQAEANYRQAQALVQNARAGFFPFISTDASATRSGSGSGSNSTSGSQYNLGLGVSWEADLWGRIRREVESSRAQAEASFADAANARLSAQSALAQNYFQLRVLDEQKRLLASTVAAYERSLKLTQNRYEAGVVGKSDVTVAEAQLESTRAQLVDLEWQRGQFEHAIAVLVGLAPSRFTLAEAQTFEPQIPDIPVGLPSQLLERRPDVAAAERRTAAANAEIGVAQAAWFPDLTLSANGGFRSGEFAQWLTAPARFWSLGPALALTLFDGGARNARLEQTRAAYDAQAAAYRLTVLTALQEVEDYLIQMRVLGEEQVVQRRALTAARESLRLARNQYQEGLIDYLDVATLETGALNSERNALNLVASRLAASVRLIAALGGGWDGLSAQQQN
ncbi:MULTISPECIES: efflux transporter outer membrane subunit [unclassified Bordetella]|uniref:efflux transporter outer membrane subunit n=1 Tax=unclassified Bordetella TaxID=2630031 RepID=UPI001328B7F5|nr:MULTISPECIES: efflux transporter outer membrane subunit [unclassified Bordetella]MVW72451.1 efflux transporter outer membrane subunit [Bordetella sp. 15P40C-2]MVW79163.1 efflux transporter outer membrane subunit [Bordetella sp. 02P26C-1]